MRYDTQRHDGPRPCLGQDLQPRRWLQDPSVANPLTYPSATSRPESVTRRPSRAPGENRANLSGLFRTGLICSPRTAPARGPLVRQDGSASVLHESPSSSGGGTPTRTSSDRPVQTRAPGRRTRNSALAGPLVKGGVLHVSGLRGTNSRLGATGRSNCPRIGYCSGRAALTWLPAGVCSANVACRGCP